jgi:hypothetical protein
MHLWLQLSTRCSIRIPLDVVRWLCMIYRAPTQLSARCLTRWAPADLVSLTGRITCDHSRVFWGAGSFNHYDGPSRVYTTLQRYRRLRSSRTRGPAASIRSVTSCRRKRRAGRKLYQHRFSSFPPHRRREIGRETRVKHSAASFYSLVSIFDIQPAHHIALIPMRRPGVLLFISTGG